MTKITDDSSSAPTRLLKQKKTVILGDDNKVGETDIIHSEEKDIPKYTDETELFPDDPAPKPPENGNDATVLFRGKANTTNKNNQNIGETVEEAELPVTGWLVIVEGPGKGRSLNVKYGIQNIGRAENQDICINFGDSMISREKHAKIIYEPNKNKFLLAPGEGKNIPYLNDEDIYVATKLKNRDIITLGNTTLCFVALCGKHFSWQ